MSVPQTEQKILCLNSGGICAFPDCGRRLVQSFPDGDPTIVGQIAHIVAEERQGPRGRSDLNQEARNRAENLILLCSEHHKIIDSKPMVFSVEVLRQMKINHEAGVARATRIEVQAIDAPLVKERLHSTLLRVVQLPAFIYAAPCDFGDRQEEAIRKLLIYPKAKPNELVPFLLKEHRLFAFHDLTELTNPFVKVVDPTSVEPIAVADLWSEPEGKRRLVTLLNKSMFKHCGRLGVRFDPAHHRFLFEAKAKGVERREYYHTLTGRHDSRNVVWQPKRRSTGEARNYWLHLAVALRFHQMAEEEWYLSIRPERHITQDSLTPFDAKYVGRKVTRLKARMFNPGYLGEVHFWRDYLSSGKPRFILNFGRQSAIIETELVPIDIAWVGIPEDIKAFTNQIFEEDLFSFAEHAGAKDDHWEDEAVDQTEEDES